MFQEIESLVRSAGKLTLTLAMEGDAMVVFVVPKGGDEPALRTPLILKASPAELEAGFAAAIAGYVDSRQSLADQVEVTKTILDAQKKSQVDKAQKALSTGSKAKGSGSGKSDVGDDEDDDGQRGDSLSNSATDTTTTRASAASSSAGGTDLASLIA